MRPATLLALLTLLAPAPTPAADNTSLRGKVLAGYQGWFAPAIDGTQAQWLHYGHRNQFEPGHASVEMWPDVAELADDERVPTAFNHPDGRPAFVFSPAHPKTVDRHFAWMKAYGIDGIFLQRFGVSVANRAIAAHHQRVMDNVRAAAKDHDRLWAVMYDLSGLRKGQIAATVIADWKRLAADQRVRDDTTYLRHDGKPVVAVWGVGFNDGRDYTLDECLQFLRFLKSDPQFGGNTVMLGVPYYWREQKNDTVKDAALHALIREADIVSPWAVGRFNGPAQMPKLQKTILEPDLAWCREHKLDYLPVIFPGFSWHNLQKLRGKDSPMDQIPRQGGQFLWSQAVAAKRAGAEMLYVAMFDEIDEGTAIFKVATDPPAGFLPLDTPRSDHYLWLTGQAGRLLRNEIPATHTMPAR